MVVVCDKAGVVLRTFRLTEGGSDRSLIPVRDVLSAVLAMGGASFAVAHNHPSGDPTPSALDRQVTAHLREAAEVVRVRFLDHVVVTEDAWQRITADP